MAANFTRRSGLRSPGPAGAVHKPSVPGGKEGPSGERPSSREMCATRHGTLGALSDYYFNPHPAGSPHTIVPYPRIICKVVTRLEPLSAPRFDHSWNRPWKTLGRECPDRQWPRPRRHWLLPPLPGCPVRQVQLSDVFPCRSDLFLLLHGIVSCCPGLDDVGHVFQCNRRR